MTVNCVLVHIVAKSGVDPAKDDPNARVQISAKQLSGENECSVWLTLDTLTHWLPAAGIN